MLFHSPLGVLFTFPSRYLFTIGQQGVLSLGGWSPQIPSGFHVSEGTQEHRWSVSAFAYGGFTLCAASFQRLLLASTVPCASPTTPPQKPGTVWALPRSLAATDGVSFDFLSCRYLDVSVPRVGFPFGMTRWPCRVSPFGHPRIVACLPAPRGFSQAPTSFIASCCQGIPHVPFVALNRQYALDDVSRLERLPARVEEMLHSILGANRYIVYPIPIRNVKELSGSNPGSQAERWSRTVDLPSDVSLTEARRETPKGGDPATGSPTATLLRLHPSRRPRRRRSPLQAVGVTTSGAVNSRGVTGGVYKARERIHRGMLIRDY